MAASVVFRTPLYDYSWWIYSAVKVVKEQPRNKGYSTTVLEKYDLKRKDGKNKVINISYPQVYYNIVKYLR